jgi:hypothetical protein
VARLKVGVIGCGAIAQIQHLPHLRELHAEFEIGGLADLSPKLLEAVGTEYGVAPGRRFLDYRDLLLADIDGVIVCPSVSHAAPSIAGFSRPSGRGTNSPQPSPTSESSPVQRLCNNRSRAAGVRYEEDRV